MDNLWLHQLRVGSKVIYHGKYRTDIAQITKITDCYVFCGDTRFSKKNGNSGSGWDRISISQFVEGSTEVLRIRDASARSKYINEIQSFLRIANGKTTEQLKKVYEATL